jgi:23S rRNA (adenine-N6)-dimethyltransferase
MPADRTAPRRSPRRGHAPPGPGAGARAVRRRVYSQNFLVDRRVVSGLVAGSGAGEGDLVLDIGAGNGLITQALARTGARVIAVERDPALARRLHARFAGTPAVSVAEADILTMRLPTEPYLVVANIPFGITTRILRHLLGQPGGALRRADVIVQAEVARKRGTRGRGTLLNACWEPWFEFGAGQRVAAEAFRPRPRVDAAVLTVRRRDQALLTPALRRDYTEFVTGVFNGARPTVASALAPAIPRSRLASLTATLGLRTGALPSQLAVDQWVALFQAVRGDRAAGAARRAGPVRAGRAARGEGFARSEQAARGEGAAPGERAARGGRPGRGR